MVTPTSLRSSLELIGLMHDTMAGVETALRRRSRVPGAGASPPRVNLASASADSNQLQPGASTVPLLSLRRRLFLL